MKDTERGGGGKGGGERERGQTRDPGKRTPGTLFFSKGLQTFTEELLEDVQGEVCVYACVGVRACVCVRVCVYV